MSKGKGLFGWLLGLIAGALLGVFFAPRKGSEARKRLKEAHKKGEPHKPLFEDLKQIGSDLAGTAKDIYNSKEVRKVIERGREKARELGGDFLDDLSDFGEYSVEPAVKHAKKNAKKAVKHAKKVHKKAKHVAEHLKKSLEQ